MAIAASISRLAGTLIDLLQTRLELATVELEEETLRSFSYLLFALVAMFCLAMTILLGTVLIVAIFWDTHRLPVLLSLIAAFGFSSVAIGLRLRSNYRGKPKMLSQTLSELRKDLARINPDRNGAGKMP